MQLLQARAFLATLAGTMLVISSVHAGNIKCWTNKDGVRECGNVVPPEYAQQGHKEISKQGTVLKEVERAKTPEEIARDEEAARQHELEEKLKEDRLMRDQMLMKTFSSEDEIVLARDGKLNIIENEIRIARRNREQVELTLTELQKKAANNERNGKPIGDELQKELDNTMAQLNHYDEFIASKVGDQQTIRTTYDDDLVRYRQLRSGKVLPGTMEQTGTQ